MILTGSKRYLIISDNFYPKILENFYFLDKKNDELYELTEESFSFILSFRDGKDISNIKTNKRFIKSLIRLSILKETSKRVKKKFILEKPPLPSLRYLEIQLTAKCNLRCRHCYQDEKNDFELPIDNLKKVLDEFVKFQGLRILLSGGEPLLYSRFKELNDYLKRYPAYVVLITNGLLLNEMPLSYIKNVDEIQISIDGMKEGHNYLRGDGTFEKVIRAVKRLKEKTNKYISFATMVHKKNLKEFKELKKLIKSFGAKEWGIDYPVLTGFFEKNKDIYPDIDSALKVIKYKFGASYHSTDEENDYACGVHTMTLLPNGNFVPCGFYPDKIFGNINEGLEKALKNRSFFRLSDITECFSCEHICLCRGGCRYRAGDIDKKDPLMCKIYGK
ncbi:MAG: radical SAM protein [Proteobacteria bacterium]|nr:radical SAM protein [Pseudomonadota bacterium]